MLKDEDKAKEEEVKEDNMFIKRIPGLEVTARKEALACVSNLYDPMGLFSAVSILSKMELQRNCKEGLSERHNSMMI